MKNLTVLFLFASSLVSAQYNFSMPIELTGIEEGARTVHFSDGGSLVFVDCDQFILWDLEEKSVLKLFDIPGYNTNKSAFDGTSIWINANVNYNTLKNDISDVHNNINVLDSNGMSSHKTTKAYGAVDLIPNSREAIIVSTTKKYTYQVVRLNIDSFEETSILFDETKDGAAVPSAIKVSDDGRFAAVSMAGTKKGLRIYDLSTNKLLKYFPTGADANDVAFSQDGAFVFVNDGKKLMKIETSKWKTLGEWELSGTITSLDANSNGHHVALAFQANGAQLFDTQVGKKLADLSTDKISDITFSNNDLYLALGIQKTVKSVELPSVLLFKLLK